MAFSSTEFLFCSSGSQFCVVQFIVILGSILWRNCLNVFLANHHSLFFCLFVLFTCFCYLQKHLSPVLQVTVLFFYSDLEIQIFYDPAPTLIPLNSESPSFLNCGSFASTLSFQPMGIALFLNYVMLIRNVL